MSKYKYNLQLFGAMEDPAAKALEINQQAKEIWKSTKALEMMDYFKVDMCYLLGVTDGVLRESEVIKEIVARLEVLEERAGYEVHEEESK